MLIYRRTSILESTAQTLVNTVNCIGVMGKGLAHAFKEREPNMFIAYRKICDQKLLSPGKLWLWRGPNSWVLNFPTKIHWRNPSKLEWIEAGLEKFTRAYQEQGITEISFPRLGCGNGNLDWEDVRPLMERYLSDLPIPIFIHDHTVDFGLPEHLEAIAEQLRAEWPSESSFDDFFKAIQRALELVGSKITDLESKTPFTAHMTPEGALEIKTKGAEWLYDLEDIRSLWLKLQKGLVTKKEASWVNPGASRPIFTLLSLLPNIRPIEIQRKDSESPEMAIELAPFDRVLANTLQPAKQQELAWH